MLIAEINAIPIIPNAYLPVDFTKSIENTDSLFGKNKYKIF